MGEKFPEAKTPEVKLQCERMESHDIDLVNIRIVTGIMIFCNPLLLKMIQNSRTQLKTQHMEHNRWLRDYQLKNFWIFIHK